MYYNHNDPNLPLELPYFYDAVELNPGVEASDKDFWINKLADVSSKLSDSESSDVKKSENENLMMFIITAALTLLEKDRAGCHQLRNQK